MRVRPRLRRLRHGAVIGALVVALTASACGGDGSDEGDLTVVEFQPVATSWLPSQILDLTVAEEEAATTLDTGDEPYIDQLGVFSLRRGELLQATLQVSHFTDEDRLDGRLRRQLAAGVGSSTSPALVRVGDQQVYLTSGGRQTVAVWFDGAYMLITSIREEYARPRALLRALVELEAGA